MVAWFIINYFRQNLDLISQARKNYRPQTNDETIPANETDSAGILFGLL